MFRRQFASSLVMLAASSIVFAAAASPEPTLYDGTNADAAVAPSSVGSVRGGIAVLEGSGGNSGVLSGRDGLFPVDDATAVSRQKLESSRQQTSPGRLRYAIDAHWRWDHIDGNARVHEDMKAPRIYVAAVPASLPGGSISRADEVGRGAEGCANKAVYEGLDDKGRVIRLTISNLHVDAFERVTPPGAARHPEPHWSSLFGTGTAAEAERQK
jgi:hypothetical protein